MSECHSNDIKKDSDITLFVKAGVDGVRYGSCPFCQRLFMLLIVKGQLLPELRFKVVTVNLNRAPTEFRRNCLRRVPALLDGDVASDNVDDILQYLEDYYPTPQLDYDNLEALTACNDLFQKFCFYIKEVSKDANSLLSELQKLNAYLQSRGTSYLCGDTLTQLDIEVLPKLHNIRIAGRYLKDFVIPSHLMALWQYLKRAYQCPAFAQSCPPDQEIILHWADKPETQNLTTEQNAQLAKEKPKHSFDIPEWTVSPHTNDWQILSQWMKIKYKLVIKTVK